MLRSRRTVRWTLAHLWLACAVLAACATPQRSSRRDLRLDSETAAKMTHASAFIEGGSSAASATTVAVASILGRSVPALLALLESDNAVGELEEQLVACARLAERQVNSQFFGNRSPTRQECGEEVEVARLIAQGCTRELWRTLEPDIVLHADHSSLLRSVLSLDFKFPFPESNEPRWTRYGENSTYSGRTQGELYKEALGGEAWLISPQGGLAR